MAALTTSATAALVNLQTVANNCVTTFCTTIQAGLPLVIETANAVMTTICDTVLSRQPDIANVATTTVQTMCNTILSMHGEFYNVGLDAMAGFHEGLRIEGEKAIATARAIANSIIAEMQRALDINSPSRKMRDLVGKPTVQGFFVGFEDEMAGLSKKMQATIDVEVAKVGLQSATQAESKAASNGVTREVTTNNKTVEKVARIEGDGVTDELVRMLGIRLKEEDNRTGDSLED